jgi:hypothetical protein
LPRHRCCSRSSSCGRCRSHRDLPKTRNRPWHPEPRFCWLLTTRNRPHPAASAYDRRHELAQAWCAHSAGPHLQNSASRSASHSRAAAPWHFGQCRLRQELYAMRVCEQFSQERVASSSLPASENLHTSRHMQCSK